VRFRFVRRHKALLVLLLILIIPTLVLGGWVLYLNHQVNEVSRFEVDLDRPGRPVRPAGEALTFLFVGVDVAQAGGSFENTMKQQDWPVGSYRSDAIMLVHLEADRSTGQVISIPRDSWVPIEGYGSNKINAAFSYGGPELLARTVEDATGAYIDHVVVVDFAGFSKASEVVDGVPVDLIEPETLDGRRYDAGEQHLEGAAALAYVRQRYNLPRGDFDRVQRQQNFLRGFLDRLGEIGPGDPLEVTRLSAQLSKLVAVDDDLTTGAIRSLAWDLRNLQGEGIRFFTAPTNGTGMVGAASVVKLDVPDTHAMWKAIAKGRLTQWEKQNEAEELPDRDSVR
jgi:LCP family protein required for cell wall assembly